MTMPNPDTIPFPASTPPKVSVVMPLYNTRAYLGEAIESILTQTFTDFELIVVDDGSNDGSPEIADGYAKQDPRVRVLRCPHRGMLTVNTGIEAAKSELVARMDSDDWSLPTRLAEQYEYMQKHPHCVAVGTWLERTDPYGSATGEQTPPTEPDAIEAALLAGDGSAIVQGTTMFRRTPLLESGAWRTDYGWVEDIDLFLRLAELGPLGNIGKVLYRYRRHHTSVCSRNYEAMCDNYEAMLSEAYRRRGRNDKPDLSKLRPDLHNTESRGQTHRNWACHAIHRGNRSIAFRHAASAMRYEPWKIDSWRVMAWAIAG